MIRSILFLAITAFAFGAMDASAAEVKVAYKGIVTQANGAQASAFVAGQDIEMQYVVETAVPDSNPDTHIGLYYSGLRQLKIWIPASGVASVTGSGVVSVNNDVLNPDPSDYVNFSGYATSGSVAGTPIYFSSFAFSEYAMPGQTPAMITDDRLPTTHLTAYNMNVSFWTSAGWTTLRVLIEPDVSCASEGYTGTKLYYCTKVCESGYSGALLEMWLRRWNDRYRPELPYCARND